MKQREHFSFLKNTRSLVMVSLFVALYAVFSIFTIYFTNQLRLSFTFVAVAFSSALFGPITGGITGALGDILAYWIKPAPGGFFPGFTISGFVSGLIYGMLLYKKEVTWLRVVITAFISVVVVEFFMNGYWLSILFGDAYAIVLAERVLKSIVMLPIQVFVLMSMRFVIKRIPHYDSRNNQFTR